MRRILRFLAASALVSVLSVGQANAGVSPPVFIDESSFVGGVEYTVSIDKFLMNQLLGTPQTTNWYIPWFAVGSSVAGGNTNITNGIGSWNSESLDATQWNNGFSFQVGTPTGSVELLNTLDFAPDSFGDLFGTDLVANAYWAGSYTDFTATNLIGATESRGGFLYGTPIVTSEFVIGLSDVSGTLGASCTGTANTSSGLNCSLLTTVSEPATVGLFGIGLIGLGLAARRRRQTA